MEFIKTCELCQRNKPSNKKPQGLLQPLPIPERKWESISMDFVTHLPKTRRGNDSILVFVDHLTKTIRIEPVTIEITAVDTTHIFIQEIFKHYGMPTSIVSDRDPRFTSNFWKAFFKELGTSLKMSTAFHPQTDGQTERANRTIEGILRNFVGYRTGDWEDKIPLVEFAYNNSTQASTGFSPFHLLYGVDPLTPGSLTAAELSNSNVPAASDLINRIKTDLQEAQTNIKAAQD
jgi:hypothetical protein